MLKNTNKAPDGTTKFDLLKQKRGKTTLACKCGNIENVGMGVKSVICWQCTAKMVAPPTNPVKAKGGEGYPRGWHLKKHFEAPDGKIFEYGEEITGDKKDDISGN